MAFAMHSSALPIPCVGCLVHSLHWGLDLDTNLAPLVICIRNFNLTDGSFMPYRCLSLETGARKPGGYIFHCQLVSEENIS